MGCVRHGRELMFGYYGRRKCPRVQLEGSALSLDARGHRFRDGAVGTCGWVLGFANAALSSVILAPRLPGPDIGESLRPFGAMGPSRIHPSERHWLVSSPVLKQGGMR